MHTNGETISSKTSENLIEACQQILKEQWKGCIPANRLRPKLLARLVGTPPSKAYFIVGSLAKTKSIGAVVMCVSLVWLREKRGLIANEIAESEQSLHLFDW